VDPNSFSVFYLPIRKIDVCLLPGKTSSLSQEESWSSMGTVGGLSGVLGFADCLFVLRKALVFVCISL